jgi:hypothetical protein
MLKKKGIHFLDDLEVDKIFGDCTESITLILNNTVTNSILFSVLGKEM